MQKPLTYYRQGFVTKKLIRSILPQALQSNQLFLIYIRRRQLTNALEFLQERGYSGDTAIFVLACCQKGAV
jgi:hypothetical protein